MHTHSGWMNAVLQWMKAAELPMFRIFKIWPKMLTFPWELKKHLSADVNWGCCWAVSRWEGVLTVSCCFPLLLKRGIPELWPQHLWQPLWHVCPWVLWEGDRLGQWLLSVRLSSRPACQVSTQVCWYACTAHRWSWIASTASFAFQGFRVSHLSGSSSCVQKNAF